MIRTRKTDRVYVAAYSNNITVIDTSTNSIVTTIELPAGDNHGIAVDSNTDMVYALVSGCTNEAHVTTASGHTGTRGWLLAFPNVFSTGHASVDLIGAGQNFPLP